jgi:hypothetical protein
MKTIEIGLPTSLGELIQIKYYLDQVKHNYNQINLSFQKSLWKTCLHTEAPDWKQKEILWNKYLADIGQLFFSEKPYILTDKTYPLYDTPHLIKLINIVPIKTEMSNFLCKGNSLNLEKDYIVITTKIRQMNKCIFYPLSIQFWQILKQLGKKYIIVILGERTVEMRKEYDTIKNEVFGIYEQIISNISEECLLDKTVCALGETSADLKDIQQDCLIMKEAKFVITFGVGGNFCMSTSVANMAIGFRTDTIKFTDVIFEGKDYSNAIITKDWNHFINTLKGYL